MTVFNRAALVLRTISKPIASGLNPRFQRSMTVTGVAQRNQGENIIEVGRLDREKDKHGLAKCIFAMIGLSIFNQKKERHAHHQRKMAFLEGFKEAMQQDSLFLQTMQLETSELGEFNFVERSRARPHCV